MSLICKTVNMQEKNSLLYETFWIRTRLKTEVKGISKMAYSQADILLFSPRYIVVLYFPHLSAKSARGVHAHAKCQPD